MATKEDSNKMYFDSDDHFYNFAVTPILKVKYDNAGVPVTYDWDFTKMYNDAVKKGVKFVIKDPKSQIFKRKAVTYNIITKPVDNLDDWIYDTEYLINEFENG